MGTRRENVTCKQCNKEFSNFISKKSQYCSSECFVKTGLLTHNTPHTENSKQKNRDNMHPNSLKAGFTKDNNYNQHPDSVRTRFKKGNRPWNWAGGKRGPSQIIKDDVRYPKWRKAVFKRDNYTCVICNDKGVYIEADHIIPKVVRKDLAFDVNNGRTLCKPCHLKTDTYGGRTRGVS